MTTITEFTNNNIENYLDNQVNTIGYQQGKRIAKNMIFTVLRRGENTIQLITFKKDNNELYERMSKINNEATLNIYGKVSKAVVKSCSVSNYEIIVNNINIINESKEVLPFTQDDVSIYCNDDDVNIVGRQIRLDNRYLELRTLLNQKIFRLKSLLEASIRNELIANNFMEIHTPKIIPAVSEGGANVFQVEYFKNKAYLAQSPQLYKQMMINSGFDNVFEIGAVYRAENACTYRHLCEFTGLDLEFTINPDQDHKDIIKKIWKILYNGFRNFEEKNKDSIKYVLDKTKTEDMIFPEEALIINFEDGVKLLHERGIDQDINDDIGTVNEKILGSIIKEKYGSDVFALEGYPKNARPFYTMPKNNSNYTKSFDIMMRCNEIASGAQRIHDPDQLKESINNKGIILDGKTGLEDYVKSFEYGSIHHGGCGIGLERLIMLYLGLKNVRETSLFPRDPSRITP